MTADIVILNWNGRNLMEEYLPSVIMSTKGLDGVNVVVADNASDDDSLRMLATSFPSVQTIALNRNYGFAEGYNRALKQLDSDIFILLNSDVEVPDGWIEPLLEWFELHPECGICGSKLHRMDERDEFEYAGAAGGYLDRFCFPFCRGRIMDRTEKDCGQYDMPSEVLWVSGASLAIRRNVFNELGGFRKDFFAHMEEIDLCWRARLEGWTVNSVPRSTVFHLGGASLPQGSPRKVFLNFRNNLLMMAGNLPKTLALSIMFNTMSRAIDPDIGPDMFNNCFEFYQSCDRKVRKDLSRLAATVGKHRAGQIIRKRMILDGTAALVYLLHGQKDSFKAVIQAHREFRAMRRKSDDDKLAAFIDKVASGARDDVARAILTDESDGENFQSDTFALKGMWNKWIVWQNIFHKDSITENLKFLR